MQLDYLQPDFYHFSSDSIFLSNFAVDFVRENMNKENLVGADWGAGCGVIGFEFLKRSAQFKSFSFYEKNIQFIPFLEANLNWLKSSNFSFPAIHILNQDYLEMVDRKKFSLILSNPPYYFEHEGRIPSDPNRALARVWNENLFEKFLDCISHFLESDGVCIFISPKAREVNILDHSKLKLIHVEKFDDEKMLFVIQSLNK